MPRAYEDLGLLFFFRYFTSKFHLLSGDSTHQFPLNIVTAGSVLIYLKSRCVLCSQGRTSPWQSDFSVHCSISKILVSVLEPVTQFLPLCMSLIRPKLGPKLRLFCSWSCMRSIALLAKASRSFSGIFHFIVRFQVLFPVFCPIVYDRASCASTKSTCSVQYVPWKKALISVEYCDFASGVGRGRVRNNNDISIGTQTCRFVRQSA